MTKKNFNIFFLLLSTFLTSGCSTQFKYTLNFDSREPLRVAILPFTELNRKNQVVNSEVIIFQRANMPKEKQEQEDPPVAYVQGLVTEQLETSLLDIIPQGVVRSQLVHNGFTAGYTYDYVRLAQTSPRELCQILTCDAILTGKLLQWSQTYLGVESVSAAEIELKLIRASDEKVLYIARAKDYTSRGITKIPTGYTDVILEPFKGLSDDIIENLARELVFKMTRPLVGKKTEPSTPGPMIIATSHNAVDGVIDRQKGLTVLMTGTPKLRASFSIGNKIHDIPMKEVDTMHYSGTYIPLDSDHFEKKQIKVKLTDETGKIEELNNGTGLVELKKK